ncbi:MAG: MFS transporter [Rhodospirillales bacterium]|nr:MFS transporter [Rhodospirillales bacterium]
MATEETKYHLGGIGRAFSDRNFRIHSIGTFASWISFFVQIVAVSWLTWELTHSTRWLAVVALLDIVPNVILGPFGGALADRYDRYWIMKIANSLLLIQAVLMAVLAWLGLLTIWPLAILVLLHGILLSFSVPAMYGMLPRFVDKSLLSSAIAVNSSYSQFAVFAGPALAGWIISVHGLPMAFAVNAFGYVMLISSMLFLKTPEGYVQPKKDSRSILGDIAEGVSYIRSQGGISSLLILLLVGGALRASVYHMAPAYSEQILGMGIEGFSIILASAGIGATIAALWLAHGGEKAASARRVLWAFLIFILAVAVLYLFESLYVAIATAIVMGLAAQTWKICTFSLIQLNVSEDQRGRVMGNMFVLMQFAGGVGTYLIGTFAVTQGLVAPMLTAVFCCFVVWLIFYVKRGQFEQQFKVISDSPSP